VPQISAGELAQYPKRVHRLLALHPGAHAHGWVTRLAVLLEICTWLWIAWQVRKIQPRATRMTIATMVLATVLTAAAVSWPMLEPIAFNALGTRGLA